MEEKKLPRRAIIIGLNAVWQRVLALDELQPGEVHRTGSPSSFFSGKGGNVAVAMERLGHPSLELIQALGGESGDLIQEDMKRFSIRSIFKEIKEETRVCSTLIEQGGRTTELVEPSPSLTEEEWAGLATLLEERLRIEADVLVCGSFPAGDASPFIEILGKRPGESKLWVDGIREDVLGLSPDVLKINHRELEGLVPGKKSIQEQCEEVSKGFGIQTLVITSEDREVCLWEEGASLVVPVPPLEKVVNTTGAGDTFFGALVDAHQSGLPWKACLEKAIFWAGLRCRLPNVEDLPKEIR